MTVTQRPVCQKCNTTMVRGATVNAKGQFTCPNTKCPDSFKVWVTR